MCYAVQGSKTWSVLWLVTAASVPLSVRLFFPLLGTEVLFPAEPLLGLISIRVVVNWLRGTDPLSSLRSALHSTVARLAVAWIGMHIFSSFFSTDPLASWKATFVQMVHVLAFLSIPLVRSGNYTAHWQQRWNWHDAAFLLVIISTLTASAVEGLDRMAVNFAPFPFYKDHTLYAAVLSFVLFHLLAKVDEALVLGRRPVRTASLMVLLIGVAAALVLSYGRGAWLGTFLALFIYGLLRPPRRWAVLFVSTSAVVLLLVVKVLFFGGPWKVHASQSHGTDPVRALRSMTNTTDDTNNIDRLIRWKVSLRMFMHAPLTGIGPGTWQARFEDFITPEERRMFTGDFVLNDAEWDPAVSIGSGIRMRDHGGNVPGNFGSAHSEHLLSLSETGIAGGLWWAIVTVLVLYHTCKTLVIGRQDHRYTVVWCSGLALFTYLVHGVFNNFLEESKAALLFWPSLAILLNGPRLTTTGSPLVRSRPR